MEQEILYKSTLIDSLADRDSIYQHQMRQLAALEKRFDKVVGNLSDQDRALVWDYVMLCEDMSQRKIQLACKYMVFSATAIKALNLSTDD